MVLFVDVRLSLFVFTRLRQLCAFEISALRHPPGLPTPMLASSGIGPFFSESCVCLKVVPWSCSVISLYVEALNRLIEYD